MRRLLLLIPFAFLSLGMLLPLLALFVKAISLGLFGVALPVLGEHVT